MGEVRPRAPRPRLLVLALVAGLLSAAACQDDEVRPPPAEAVGPPGIPTSSSAPRPTVPPAPPTTVPPQGFSGSVSVIDDAIRARMTSTWRPGCPVPLSDLRLVRITYWGFDARAHLGEVVVHADVAEDVVGVFRAAYDARFPIERVELADVYGGDDEASMAANNTSAFNCRAATGSTRWSEHAYGRAVDINPVQNPYVTRAGVVSPPAGAAYVDRGDVRPGMLIDDDAVVSAFDGLGWGWGGRWVTSKDYQHLSANGR